MKLSQNYKRWLRKFLGAERYQDAHALKVFQSISAPFPSQATQPANVDWSRAIEKSDRVSYTPAVYMVSPIQRSGTNYLHIMLGMHPDLSTVASLGWPQEQCLFSAGAKLAEYVSQTAGYWSNWVQDPSERQEHARRMMAQLGEGCLTHFAAAPERDGLMVFKTPDSGNVRWMYHMFPQMKVIVLVRDGRDAITSYINSWGGKSIFRRLCIRWNDRMNQLFDLQTFANENQYAAQLCFVKYEDLVQNPEASLREIFAFLDVSPEAYPYDSLAEIPVLGSSSMKAGDRVHWKPMSKPASFNPTGKWMDWSKHQRAVFKKYAGEALLKMKYEANDTW